MVFSGFILFASVLFTLGTVFGLYVLYRIGGSVNSTFKANLILWIIAISAILPVVLTHRILDFNFEKTSQVMVQAADGIWVSRLMTVTLLGVVVVEAIRGFVNDYINKKGRNDGTRILFWSIFLYEFGMIFLSVTGATHRSFSHKYLYVPLTLIAVYYLAKTEFDIKSVVVNGMKLSMLALILGSLVAAAVKPEFALFKPYSGSVFGIDMRLYGLARHANTLGPIALLLIIFEVYFPSRKKLIKYFVISSAFAVFILSQSKTAWMAAIMIMLLVVIPLYFYESKQKTDGFEKTAVMIFLFLLASILFLSFSINYFDVLQDIYLDKDISSLTGRTLIWDRTFAEVDKNPVFGYGLEMWGLEYRIREGMLYVGHAHNQFMQTLGEGGLMGLFLLLTYLSVLFTYSVKLFKVSRGLVLALFLLIIAGCITEAPFKISDLSWTTYSHAVLIIITTFYVKANSNKEV